MTLTEPSDILAQHLARVPVVPTVAGEEVTLGAVEAARAGNVLVLQGDKVRFWEEALAAVLGE